MFIIIIYIYNPCIESTTVLHVCIHVNERCGKRSKQGQTNNKAKQHSTPNMYSVRLAEM